MTEEIVDIYQPNLVTRLPVSTIDIVLGSAAVAMASPLIAIAPILMGHPEQAQVLFRTEFYAMATASAGIGTLFLSQGVDLFSSGKQLGINFEGAFGVDPKSVPQMPLEERLRETTELNERLNDEYVPLEYDVKTLARIINPLIMEFMAKYTGQRIHTSDKVRTDGILARVMPYAGGLCILVGKDITINTDKGIFNAHATAHELVHRYGYGNELEAQVLAYLTLSQSDDASLRQSAHAERLHRQIRTLKKVPEHKEFAERTYEEIRPELKEDFDKLFNPKPTISQALLVLASLPVILPAFWLGSKIRKETPANYTENFTDYLYAMEKV